MSTFARSSSPLLHRARCLPLPLRQGFKAFHQCPAGNAPSLDVEHPKNLSSSRCLANVCKSQMFFSLTNLGFLSTMGLSKRSRTSNTCLLLSKLQAEPWSKETCAYQRPSLSSWASVHVPAELLQSHPDHRIKQQQATNINLA